VRISHLRVLPGVLLQFSATFYGGGGRTPLRRTPLRRTHPERRWRKTLEKDAVEKDSQV